jgi:hypothetical protein
MAKISAKSTLIKSKVRAVNAKLKEAKRKEVLNKSRELKKNHLKRVCAEIESLRSSSGRIPRGAMLQVYNEQKEVYHWLTIDIIKKELKKSKGKTDALETTIISDITEGSDFDNEAPLPPLPPIHISFHEHSEPHTSGNDPSDAATGTPSPDDPPPLFQKKRGRPTLEVLQARRDRNDKEEALLNEIALEWDKRVKAVKGNGVIKKRMKRNELQQLIDEKKLEHGLTDYNVTKSCIRQRVQKNKLERSKTRGTISPMAPVENYIVSLMTQMAKMRQPINVSEGLELANSLIEGTEWEQKVVNFKARRGWMQFTSDGKKKWKEKTYLG